MNSQRTGVFTVDERNRIRDRILELAKSDERIVAGAVVGSLATGEGDRWSDLDLSFGVIPENQALDVLDRLTAPLVTEFGAVPLFDLPYRESIFRVLLLQGCLQVDLSVTPASKFGPNGPKFQNAFWPLYGKPTCSRSACRRVDRVRRASCCPCPLLYRTRALLAGGILDKRRPRLHS